MNDTSKTVKWYWKVRLYNTTGQYAHACITTCWDLKEIDLIQDTYQSLTGAKMLLEGMSDEWFSECPTLQHAFNILWKDK